MYITLLHNSTIIKSSQLLNMQIILKSQKKETFHRKKETLFLVKQLKRIDCYVFIISFVYVLYLDFGN